MFLFKKLFPKLISFLFLIAILQNCTTGLELAKSEEVKRKDYFVDWSSRVSEATKHLQSLIRFRTERGKEDLAVNYLAEIFKRENIPYKIITYPGKKDRANIIAEIGPLSGSPSEKGIILCNHLDVVEAQDEEWTVPPYEGLVKDERVYGRGAIDMKGMATLELMVFLEIKRRGVPLKRKLMFLGLADEETGSVHGSQFLLEKHPELFQNYEYVINEGGIGTDGVAFAGTKVFNLQFAEKGILWMDVTAKATSGHGSTPPTEYASLNLMNFYKEVREMETGATFIPETSKFFYQLGTVAPFPSSFFLKNANIPGIKQLVTVLAINKNRHLRAMTSNTRSVTGLSTDEGSGYNTITATAKGKLDVRLLPGVDYKEYFSKLEKIAEKHNVSLKLFSGLNATSSPIDDELFKKFGRIAMDSVPGSTVTPLVSPGGTDNAYFRAKGLKAYGLIPVLVTAKDLDGMHGKDENMSIENLKLGMGILYDTVLSMN